MHPCDIHCHTWAAHPCDGHHHTWAACPHDSHHHTWAMHPCSTLDIVGLDPTGPALDVRTIWEREYVLTGEMYVKEGGLELDEHAPDAPRAHLSHVSFAPS